MNVSESSFTKFLTPHIVCQGVMSCGSFLVDPLQRCIETRLSQICETKNRAAEA